MEQDLKIFIDSRINGNFEKIRQKEEIKQDLINLEKHYKKFYNELTDDQKDEFDEILALKNTIYTQEKYLAYELGMKDTIELLRM